MLEVLAMLASIPLCSGLVYGEWAGIAEHIAAYINDHVLRSVVLLSVLHVTLGLGPSNRRLRD